MDAAAVLKNLDLVISVDTAIAHLAGALGIPVWVALPFAPDWRWLMGREDSPWYPTMRLFRQDRAGDWASVFAEIRVATEKMAAEKREQETGAETPGARGTRSPASRPGQEAQTPAVVPDPTRGDSRLLLDQGHVRVKHCRYGPMAYLATDQYIGQSLDRYGEFSEGEVELFRQVIRPGWTVVEIGANIGAHTVFLAKATGSLGRVLAFEPQRVIFQVLCANLVLNGLSHVETFHAAAGREPGTITVPRLDYTARQNFGGVSLGSHAAGEAVQQMTIDGLKLPACHLLKIDVEGMEADVLAGAEQTIRRWRPVLYVENDRPEKSAELIRQVLGLGYRLYWHLPRLFNPHNYFGVTENIFGTIVSVNMLGFHGSISQNMTDLREITDPEDDWKTSADAQGARSSSVSMRISPTMPSTSVLVGRSALVRASLASLVNFAARKSGVSAPFRVADGQDGGVRGRCRAPLSQGCPAPPGGPIGRGRSVLASSSHPEASGAALQRRSGHLQSSHPRQPRRLSKPGSFLSAEAPVVRGLPDLEESRHVQPPESGVGIRTSGLEEQHRDVGIGAQPVCDRAP